MPSHTAPTKPGYDHRDDRLEGVALCLLDASAPASQMLKIRAKLFSIFFVDSERGQCRRDRFENHCIDIVVTNPLLFGQGLDDDGPDIRSLLPGHRLMIRATFSKPRLAK